MFIKIFRTKASWWAENKTCYFVFLFLLANEILAQLSIPRLPSESAGDQGLVLRITPPKVARYNSLAPIVIRVPGGIYGNGLKEMEIGFEEFGFIDIVFNFPGSGSGDMESGGEYDYRGMNCLKALRDVILFAQGKLALESGQFLGDYIQDIIPQYDNVGIVGYSNGGNTLLCCAGMYGSVFSELKWIVTWESPVGDGMLTADVGTWPLPHKPSNPIQNPAYNPDTGEFDLSSLSYSTSLRVPQGDAEKAKVINGGLYFDFDEDGDIDENRDFVADYYTMGVEGTIKAFYSEQIINYAYANNILPQDLPPHMPSIEQAHEFWILRNGEEWIDDVARLIPDLGVIICGSKKDHYLTAIDHPHILLQYEKFLNSQIKFTRLIPDKSYLEYLFGYSVPDASDNEANIPFDHFSIRDVLEPDIGVGVNLLEKNIVIAAACEMSDRTQKDDFSPQLETVLKVITDIGDEYVAPGRFALYQNYPNPFNPSTNLEFYLDESSNIELTIFNSLGEKVTSIYKGFISKGKHRITWTPVDIPAGVYFCQLSVLTPIPNIKIDTKKLVYLK